jgi:hypothetical protein
MKLSIFLSSLLGQLFRHERIVLSTVAAIILIGGYAAILNPIVRDIREVGILDYNRESRQLTERQAYQARLNASLDKFRALAPDTKASLEQTLPMEEDLPGLFVYLDNLFTQSGMTMTSVAVTAGTAITGGATPGDVVSANLRSLNIQVAAAPSTEYQPVKTLMQNLELSKRLFDVVSVNFTASSGSSTEEAADSSITLSLRTYYLADQK